MIQPIIDEQLCFAVYHTQKMFNQMYAKALKDFQLTYPQYLVLLVLFEKDNLSLKEIGEKLSLDSGTLTPMIKRMEQNGYLKKERSQEDERHVMICLTKEAYEKKTAILESVGTCLSRLSLTEEDYFSLLKKLNHLSKELGGIVHEKDLRNAN